MATTKPPHNGAQATEDLLEVEVFKGKPNTLVVKDESLRYRFIQLPRQHLNQILLLFFFAVFVFLLFFLLRSAYQTLDSLDCALSAKMGDGMSHSHHLLYIPFVYVFRLLISPICGLCNIVVCHPGLTQN